jgi:hypothetical protein
MEVNHPMQPQPNPAGPHRAPVDGLIHTRDALVACAVCGHEHIDPECSASTRRSFAMLRDLREQR